MFHFSCHKIFSCSLQKPSRVFKSFFNSSMDQCDNSTTQLSYKKVYNERALAKVFSNSSAHQGLHASKSWKVDFYATLFQPKHRRSQRQSVHSVRSAQASTSLNSPLFLVSTWNVLPACMPHRIVINSFT